jgi:drug/metabolite transporter superfamily protein YnfA
LTDTALSLAMLTALALLAGAVFLWRKGERQRPALMAILAAVMITNVVIWSLPTRDGQTLAATGAPQ